LWRFGFVDGMFCLLFVDVLLSFISLGVYIKETGVTAMRVFGYARVSVSHEDINNQIKAIEDYCARKGYELLKIFTDTMTGVSSPIDRPEFRKMLTYAKELGVNRIIVYDLSRLGRSLSELFATLKILKDNGIVVEFIKHQELLDMDERSFTIFVTTIGLAVQLEREFMHQRLEQARIAGKHIGRKPVEIPIDLVKRYLSKGLSKKDVYRLLVSQGYLKYKVKGEERTMTYYQFIRRLKVAGI